MRFKTINIHCIVIFCIKDNCNDTDILEEFYLIEPLAFMLNIIPIKILQTKEYSISSFIFEMSITDQLFFMVTYRVLIYV